MRHGAFVSIAVAALATFSSSALASENVYLEGDVTYEAVPMVFEEAPIVIGDETVLPYTETALESFVSDENMIGVIIEDVAYSDSAIESESMMIDTTLVDAAYAEPVVGEVLYIEESASVPDSITDGPIMTFVDQDAPSTVILLDDATSYPATTTY